MASAPAVQDERSVSRDEVEFRTRGFGPDGKPFPLLIVNISALGLMARCDRALAAGDPIRVQLPVLGSIAAEIRWSLGGRIGCELARAIDLADYYTVLAAMIRR